VDVQDHRYPQMFAGQQNLLLFCQFHHLIVAELVHVAAQIGQVDSGESCLPLREQDIKLFESRYFQFERLSSRLSVKIELRQTSVEAAGQKHRSQGGRGCDEATERRNRGL
jgi:hypothetical protein